MRRTIFLSVATLLLVTLTNAQTVSEVFEKTNKAYSDAENISMNIQYDLYSNYTSNAPYESSSGTYIKQGNSYYSNLLGITTIQNKKYKLSISNDEKIIIVGDPVKTGKAPSVVETDTLLKQCSSTEVRKTTEGSTVCVLHFEQVPFSEFDRIEIETSKNGFVTKMVLYYREAISLDETNPQLKKEKPRLVITYSNINTNPTIKPDQFSEKPYISDNGKQITGTPAYSTYRILNHKK